MPDLHSVPAAIVGGQVLSLQEVLYSLKLKGQLGQILRQAVTDRLVALAAKREGVMVTPEELQKGADGFRLRHGLNRADATNHWLKSKNLSPADMEAALGRALLLQKMMARVALPEKIEQSFAQHRARFDRVRLARIVVADEGQAQEILAQLREDGNDFGQLARKHSLDARAKASGGRIGLVNRKTLAPPVERAVFAARPGETVGPFRLETNYHLLKVEQLLPGQLTPRVRNLLGRQLFAHWLAEQAKGAGVEIKLFEQV
jgi:parvulin-like peptidyl-prolyl isomerase